MNRIFSKFIIIMVMLLSIPIVMSLNTLNCNWVPDGTCKESNVIFYAHKDYFDSSPEELVLSSNVQTYPGGDYTKELCCTPIDGAIEFSTQDINNCPVGSKPIMNLTSETNARVSFVYNEDHHFYSTCVKYTSEFSNIDIFHTNDEYKADQYEKIGYTCLYRTSSIVNGHVSDCDATFNIGDKYEYSVWARLWENTDNLNCNTDCTSKLDNRVYTACANKISSCRGIDPNCDGSLLGGWVDSSENPNNQEIQCSGPWTNTRDKVFSQETINFKASSDCLNIVARKYSVLIDNELVTMNILICDK